jgi:TP901 family phage tail tape measure protein
MAGVAKGIIDIQINTGSAAAELKALQNQINSFNAALAKGNLAQGKFASDYTKDLSKAINASGLFTSEFMKMNSAAANLDNTLKKGKGTLGQFFSSAFNKNSSAFAATMDLAARRASTLQTQFINTGASAKGMGEALAIRPLDAFSSKAAIAAERQALLNTMFRQGTTHMINFGKNVQWSGRQLMVGFTVPLTVLGSVAGRTFMDIEKQLVNLKKVYGDAFTTPEEVNQNIAQVRQLAEEYTKYGIAVKDTIGMAANAAASGARNADLIDATRQATRLATLGQMEQQEALKTTIALQSAFRLSGEELADTINFLNMVENQTVVSLQDLSAAIPRVAPVIKGLGGDVRDMSVFLAAMQEGGVSAEQGANALKSGLASLINPTKAATETLSSFGINLDKIISTNRGDLMGTVFAFGEALKGLDDFSKQQALEKVFGKYQYARLGALFENIVRDGSQASQVLSLMEYDVTALRTTAEKELAAVENALGTQLTGAVERLKLSLEPIGELFVKMAIPVVNFLTKIVEKFDGLSDGQKQFAAIAAVIVGVVVPAGTMFLGLLINLLGTLGKITHGFGIFGKALIKGGPVAAVKALTQSTKYLSIEELEAAGAAKQLASSTQIANAAMLEQATSTGAARNAVAGLVAEYRALIAVQQQAAASSPGLRVAGAAGAAAAGGVKASSIRIRGLRRNKGGPIFMSGGTTVPGVGNTDTVPAMLTPGEFVVNKQATAQNYALLDAINSGNKFNKGGMIPGMQYFAGRMPNRIVQPIRSGVFGKPEISYSSAANARRQAQLEDMAASQAGRQPRPAPPSTAESRSNFVYGLQRKTNQGLNTSGVYKEDQKFGIPSRNLQDDMISSEGLHYIDKFAAGSWNNVSYVKQLRENFNRIGSSYPGKNVRFVDDHMIDDIVMRTANDPKYKDVQFVSIKDLHDEKLLSTLSSSHLDTLLQKNTQNTFQRRVKGANRATADSAGYISQTFKYPNLPGLDDSIIARRPETRDGIRTPRIERKAMEGDSIHVNENGTAYLYTLKEGRWVKGKEINLASTYKPVSGANSYMNIRRPESSKKIEASHVGYNSGGAVQYFGARMPNRVVAKSQIKKFSGTKVEDSTGHSSRFKDIAGVYDVNGRKMFVKPFQSLAEAQAELIGNAARRRIAGTATPGSRIVRMDGPEGEIFATTAPMIPGMKAGTTLPTKELLKQIPASSMLGDMDATAGNILSTGGGKLATIDPGAAAVKLIRNSKGVFRRATGSEISFGNEATNTGAYTARAITQVTEKTGASKDFVKMLGDSIAREGLTKAQFAKMYDDAVESAIARVPSFRLPSRIGDRSALDEAAKAAGYKNADEAYSAIMLRDLTSIRGLGGDIYSSASRFQGMLKANKGSIVPGQGNTDTVPAMLTPGEFVVNKDATRKNYDLLTAINSGNMQGLNMGGISYKGSTEAPPRLLMNSGGKVPGMQYFAKENRQRMVLPGSPLRRAQIMMGMSDPYQRQSRSNTGQGVFTDTSMTPARAMIKTQLAMDAAATRMVATFKKISDNNMAYAAMGAKSTMLRESIEKQVIRQQLIHADRMVGINANLAKIGPAMTAGTNLIKTAMANGAKSLATTARNLPSTIMGAMSGRGIGQAMMMGSMVPMMASGLTEDPNQQKALMGAGAAMSIIPMLMQLGPVLGGVVAALGLAGAAFYSIRKQIDNTAKSAAVAGSNLGGAANRMDDVTKATGYGFASTRAGNADFRFTEKQAQGASEIMPYFDTDEGKKLIEEMKKLSSQERYEKVASMLTFAIADGMAPEKAESFGSAIAFALDDALLKSKVIALIKSGTLQSGSDAMIAEIKKREQALEVSKNQSLNNISNKPLPYSGTDIGIGIGATALGAGAGFAAGTAVASAMSIVGATTAMGAAAGSTVPILGTVVGALVGAAAGFVAYKIEMDKVTKATEIVGKTFGSNIQIIKELNNAESLLREERKNGLISLEEYEAKEKQIEAMRSAAYQNISNAVVSLKDAGSTAQAISDQLQLGGFDKNTADLISRQTDREKVASEVFQKSFDDLDASQKDMVGKIIASTLDGISPENYATKLADVQNVWATYKEALTKAAEDGIALTAQDMQAIFDQSQLKNFVSSITGPDSGASVSYDPQNVAEKMQTTIESSGTALSYDQIVNALTELGDPDLAVKVGTNVDSIKSLEKILTNLPDGFDISMYTSYLNGDTEFTDPEAYTKSIQDVIDKIAKAAPSGFNPIEIFKLFEGTGKDPVKELEVAATQAQSIINKIGGDDSKTKQVIFETTGMELTQKEVDAYNALGPGESKSFITSFIVAAAKLDLGEMPKQEDFAKYGMAAGAAFKSAMDDYKKQVEEAKTLAKSLQGIDNTPSPVTESPDASGSSGKPKTKKELQKEAKDWLSNSQKELKTLNQYTTAINGVVDGNNAEAISMIPQDIYMNLSTANRKIAIEEMNKQIKAQERLNAILAVASIQENTKDLKEYLTQTNSLVSQGIDPEIAAMVDMKTYLSLNAAERKEYIKSLNSQTEAQKKLNAVQGLLDVKKNVNGLKDQLNVTKQLVGQGISGEIAGLVDVEIYQHLATAAKAEYINKLKEQLNVQRALEFLTKSSEERTMDTIDLEASAMTLQNSALETKLSGMERENELIQRQITIRNHALDLLAKEEEKVNKTYDDRISALDKVEKANSRIDQQNRSKIGLASALASGDIAGAASAAGEIQAQDAQYQIEDARSALEAQRQKEIESLSISVNGVLMTRKQIQEQIASFGETIYKNEQDMQAVQDTLYDNSVKQGILDEQRAKLEQKILLTKMKQNIEALRAQNLTGQALKDFQDYIDAYNLAETAAVAAGVGTPGQASNTTLGAGGGGGAADNIAAQPVTDIPAPAASTPAASTPAASTPAASTPATTTPAYVPYTKAQFKAGILNSNLSYGSGKEQHYIAKAMGYKDPEAKTVKADAMDEVYAGLSNDKKIEITKLVKRAIAGPGYAFYTGGEIPGIGGMDSVNISATPGEFMIRKAMVGKYGLPMLEAINMGAFKIPEMSQPTFGISGSRYDIPESGKTQGPETMYNNTYNVNVNVAGTDASPDDIANVVMAKLSQQNRGNLRSNRY